MCFPRLQLTVNAVFPRLLLVTGFPAPPTSHLFPARATCSRSLFFPHLLPVTYFPALSTSQRLNCFSRACKIKWLHIFPRKLHVLRITIGYFSICRYSDWQRDYFYCISTKNLGKVARCRFVSSLNSMLICFRWQCGFNWKREARKKGKAEESQRRGQERYITNGRKHGGISSKSKCPPRRATTPAEVWERQRRSSQASFTST